MKKYILYSTTLLLTAIITFSCDRVKDVRDPNAPKVEGNRKVLVEDYTGHKCGNCPAAADTLQYLEQKYPGKIIPLAIHAGFFSTVNAAYPTDFRTTVGNTYDSQFGISAAGNPNGLINRSGFGTGGFIKAYTSWESEISQMITKTAKFEIRIKNTFNAVANNLSSSITVKSLDYNNGAYKLVVLLTEDSVIAEQLDYRIVVPPAPSQKTTNYEFNHVLRAAINSEWGDGIFTTKAAQINDSIVKTYSNFNLGSYNPAKCHVIAYVFDNDSSSPTYYEVLQAEEAKVK